jgi:hypothetical protein
MSTLTTAEREQLPLDDFVIPEHRVMPVIDAGDVEQAQRLLRSPSLRHRAAEARQRLAAIARRKGLAVPPDTAGGASAHFNRTAEHTANFLRTTTDRLASDAQAAAGAAAFALARNAQKQKAALPAEPARPRQPQQQPPAETVDFVGDTDLAECRRRAVAFARAANRRRRRPDAAS